MASDAVKKRRKAVADAFENKPIPGGLSSTALNKALKALQRALGQSEDEKKKKKNKSQADRLFGKD